MRDHELRDLQRVGPEPVAAERIRRRAIAQLRKAQQDRFPVAFPVVAAWAATSSCVVLAVWVFSQTAALLGV